MTSNDNPMQRAVPSGPMKVIVRVTAGNAVGVVEEPAHIVADMPLESQYWVKIGVLDEHAPCSAKQFQAVIDQLLDSLTTLTPAANDHDG